MSAACTFEKNQIELILDETATMLLSDRPQDGLPLTFITSARLAATPRRRVQPNSGKLTVTEVAGYSRFENVNRVSRTYRARHGKTPATTLGP